MSFATLVTTAGQAKLTASLAAGTPLSITQMSVGDGNGSATTPDPSNTALVHEVYRAALNSLAPDPANPANLVAQLVIPSAIGGWTVRECGLWAADGTLIAIANLPDTAKPLPSGGSARDLILQMVFTVGNVAAVSLNIDPSVALASKAWVIATFYIDAPTTVTVGSQTGTNFPDIATALAAVESVRIGPQGSYMIQVLDNGAMQPAVTLTAPAGISIGHPDANRISIVGTTVATIPVTGVVPNGPLNAVLQSDGSYQFSLNATDTSMVAVGDYIAINATAQRPIPLGAFYSDTANLAKIWFIWHGSTDFAIGDKIFLTNGLGPNTFPPQTYTVVAIDGPGKNGVTLDRPLPVAVANTTNQTGTPSIRAARAYVLKNGATQKAGGVSFTAGSSTLTGSGTSFLADINAGDMLIVSNFPCMVASVQDNTHLTLTSPATESISNCAFIVASNPANLNGAFRVMAKTATTLTVRTWVKFNASVAATAYSGPTSPGPGNALNGTSCIPCVGLSSLNVRVFKSVVNFTADAGFQVAALYRFKNLAIIGDDEHRTGRSAPAINVVTDDKRIGNIGLEVVAIAGFDTGYENAQACRTHIYGDLFVSNIRQQGVFLANKANVETVGNCGVYISASGYSGIVMTRGAIMNVWDCTVGGCMTPAGNDGHGIIPYDLSFFGCNSWPSGRGLSIANVGGSGLRPVAGEIFADTAYVFATGGGSGATNHGRLSVSWAMIAGAQSPGCTALWANMSQVDATGVCVTSACYGIASDQGSRVIADCCTVGFCAVGVAATNGSQLSAYMGCAGQGSNPWSNWLNGALYAANKSSMQPNAFELRGFNGNGGRVNADLGSVICARDLLIVSELPSGGNNFTATGGSTIAVETSASRAVSTNPSSLGNCNNQLQLWNWTLSGAAAPNGGSWSGSNYFN